MDNQISQPSLVLPAVPADFETKCGTTKTDFVKAIFQLLSGTKISGIQQEEPSPYDLSELAASVEAHQVAIEEITAREPRRITVAGVNNGVVVVPFQDVGTNNYQVDVAFVTPNENFPQINWAIIDDSKQSDQVSLRVDGTAGAYTLEVTITPMTGVE